MTTFYIAANKQDQARALRDDLVKQGHLVNSRWLEEKNYASNPTEKTTEEKSHIAIMDLEDVAKADALVLISEPPDENVPGGKHIETGAALCDRKPVYVIGRKENIFHNHPLVTQYDTKEAFLAAAPVTNPADTRQDPRSAAVESLLWRAGRDLIQRVYSIDLSKKDQVVVVTVGTEDNPATVNDMQGVQQMLAVLFADTGIRGCVMNNSVTMSAVDKSKFLEFLQAPTAEVEANSVAALEVQ